MVEPSRFLNLGGGLVVPNPKWAEWFMNAPTNSTPVGTVKALGDYGTLFSPNNYGVVLNNLFGAGAARDAALQYLNLTSSPRPANPLSGINDFLGDIGKIGDNLRGTTQALSWTTQLLFIGATYMLFSSAGGVKGIKRGLGL